MVKHPPLEVLCLGDKEVLARPCVDCGLVTGCFCDHCKAADRSPGETWAPNQMTPLCTCCDRKWGACHFCRKLHWCVPPPTTRPAEAKDELRRRGASQPASHGQEVETDTRKQLEVLQK